MSQFLLGILIIAIGGVLVWLGGHLATEGWKKWQQSSTQPIHKDKEQENSPLTPPTPKKEVSTKPTFYIFENETAEGERTVSFWAWGEGTLSIGFECALGTTVEDATGGFVEVDERRIYTGKNMRRVFSHQINFTVSPGHHLITVGFDRRIYVAYVKIFGLRGVEELRSAVK